MAGVGSGIIQRNGFDTAILSHTIDGDACGDGEQPGFDSRASKGVGLEMDSFEGLLETILGLGALATDLYQMSEHGSSVSAQKFIEGGRRALTMGVDQAFACVFHAGCFLHLSD